MNDCKTPPDVLEDLDRWGVELVGESISREEHEKAKIIPKALGLPLWLLWPTVYRVKTTKKENN